MTKEELDKLLPCPFCGGTEVRLCSAMNEVWVRCYSCNATSPLLWDDKKAIKFWNTRSPSRREADIRRAIELAREGARGVSDSDDTGTWIGVEWDYEDEDEIVSQVLKEEMK
jgi:Lar family restriction alleviation protein